MENSVSCAGRPARTDQPRRSARFEEEPGFHEPSGLWLYGNVRVLLGRVVSVEEASWRADHSPKELDAVAAEAEELVLSGGFVRNPGAALAEQSFREAQLRRRWFDAVTDLAVSRRAPDRLPTFALVNPAVDRLIAQLVSGTLEGAPSSHDQEGVRSADRVQERAPCDARAMDG